MASLNRVILIGNLGKDPEIRYTESGNVVATFPLATSDKFKGKAGDWQERTEWHNITLWARLAEIAGEYLAKGKGVFIEGRLKTRKWQDKEGKDRYTTDIIGEKMLMLGGGNGNHAQESKGGSGGNAGSVQDVGVMPINPGEDEIPFLLSPIFGPVI
jgi:single-strand DNA-binding protein